MSSMDSKNKKILYDDLKGSVKLILNKIHSKESITEEEFSILIKAVAVPHGAKLVFQEGYDMLDKTNPKVIYSLLNSTNELINSSINYYSIMILIRFLYNKRYDLDDIDLILINSNLLIWFCVNSRLFTAENNVKYIESKNDELLAWLTTINPCFITFLNREINGMINISQLVMKMMKMAVKYPEDYLNYFLMALANKNINKVISISSNPEFFMKNVDSLDYTGRNKFYNSVHLLPEKDILSIFEYYGSVNKDDWKHGIRDTLHSVLFTGGINKFSNEFIIKLIDFIFDYIKKFINSWDISKSDSTNVSQLYQIMIASLKNEKIQKYYIEKIYKCDVFYNHNSIFRSDITNRSDVTKDIGCFLFKAFYSYGISLSKKIELLILKLSIDENNILTDVVLSNINVVSLLNSIKELHPSSILYIYNNYIVPINDKSLTDSFFKKLIVSLVNTSNPRFSYLYNGKYENHFNFKIMNFSRSGFNINYNRIKNNANELAAIDRLEMLLECETIAV